MKPLNHLEVKMICEQLNSCCGIPLQKVTSTLDTIEFGFWTGDKNIIWQLSLKANLPLFLPASQFKIKKNVKKPWIHFLTNHFLNSVLQRAEVKHEGERILILHFSHFDYGEQEIEMNLFPKGVNLILRSNQKQVSYKKVKEFTASSQTKQEFKVRSLEKLQDEFQASHKKTVKKQVDYKALYLQEIKKVKKIKSKLSMDLLNKKEKVLIYRKLTEEINLHQNLDFETSFASYLDTSLTPYQNLNLLYERLKKEKEKIEGGQNRLAEIEQKLQQLEDFDDPKKWYAGYNKVQQRNIKPSKNKKGTKFKTYPLNGDYQLLCGYSAKNNDELIKMAKPWHVWMHLRDYPSTHGIIPLNKGESLSHSVLTEAGRYLVEHNFKGKKDKFLGLKFNLIHCQVRFLKKVKGSPGKVTYINDKNVLIQMPK